MSKDVRVKVRELHTPQGRASLAHALDQNIRALVDGATHQGGQLVDSTYKIHRPMIREIATLQARAPSTGSQIEECLFCTSSHNSLCVKILAACRFNKRWRFGTLGSVR